VRPIWARLEAGGARSDAVITAAVVLAVTIAARFAWVMLYSALMRWHLDRAADGL
jgi:monovalent cation/hydrogen antiporter